MRAEQSITPLYIPEDLLLTYGPDARLQVAASAPAPTAPSALTEPPPVADTAWLVRIAAYAGLGLWAVLVAVWTWLALHTPAMWAPIAVVGVVVLALAAVALPGMLPRPAPTRAGHPLR